MNQPLDNNAEVCYTTSKERAFLLAARQALLMLLGALEDYLGIERSVVPNHRRK